MVYIGDGEWQDKILNPLNGHVMSSLAQLEKAVEAYDIYAEKRFENVMSRTMLKKGQRRDALCSKLRSEMGSTPPELRTHCFRRGILCLKLTPDATLKPHRVRIMIPEALQRRVIQQAHEQWTPAHWSPNKTLAYLSQVCYFPNMKWKVEKYISTCKSCKPGHTWKSKECDHDMHEGRTKPYMQKVSVPPYGSRKRYPNKEHCSMCAEKLDIFKSSGLGEVYSKELLRRHQWNDPWCKIMIRMQAWPLAAPAHLLEKATLKMDNYVLRDNLLCYKVHPNVDLQPWAVRLVIPPTLREVTIHHAHTLLGFPHLKVDKTVAFLQEICLFKNMYQEVRNYICHCTLCHKEIRQPYDRAPPTLYQTPKTPTPRPASYKAAPREAIPTSVLLAKLMTGA